MISKRQQNIIIETLKPFHPKRIGLFGSVLRNDFTEKSDIDIIVDFDKHFDNINSLKPLPTAFTHLQLF